MQVVIAWSASSGVARGEYDVWVIEKNRQEQLKFRWYWNCSSTEHCLMLVGGNPIQGFTGSAASVTIRVELGLPDVKQISHGI